MKNSDGSRVARRFIIICVALVAVAFVTWQAPARAVSTSVTIVNNSSRVIRNVYTSHVDADDWSANLLGEATIAAGQSLDVSNLACDGQQVKVIAEDEDGCFLSTVVTCGQNSSWTVSNSTARDCGY